MPYAVNGNVRIHYDVEGDGAPLVLGHGSTADGASWRDWGYVDLLKDEFKLILVDARGHGRSDKPRDPSAYELPRRVGDFVAVLDALGIGNAHYWGYSMGGWMGLGCARYAPDRFHSFVIGASHPYFRDMSLARRGFQQGPENWIVGLDKAFGKGMPQVLRSRFLQNDFEVMVAAHMDRPDFHEVLSMMMAPSLFYVGESDALFPEVKIAASQVPTSQFFSLRGIDHATAMWRTDLVVPRVRAFLKRVRVPS